MILAFNKPYGVISQFTRETDQHRTLSEFGFPKGVYPVGRLDADSEGLLLLSDEKAIVQRLLDPAHGHPRTYWVQVEREPSDEAMRTLETGVPVEGRTTLPCLAWKLHPQPELPERTPPVRFRREIPTFWIALQLREGRNRQVRRMTAAVKHPTLRLLRVAIGDFAIADLEAGHWQELHEKDRKLLFRSSVER